MRHSQSEKMAIIRVVENSSLGIKRTLAELDINRSTFSTGIVGIVSPVMMVWLPSPQIVVSSGMLFLPM